MSLVNISEGSSLALHGLALISGNQPERLNIKVLAEKLDASQAHMAKVFQKLGKAGLVKSVRGPNGGFELGKPAREITFLEIYEVIEGRVILGGCPLGKKNCIFDRCIFSDDLNRISSDVYNTFKKITLSDFEE